MTQFSIQWILSLNRLSQKWGQVHSEESTTIQKTKMKLEEHIRWSTRLTNLPMPEEPKKRKSAKT
jgi:hypothetical protein